MSALEWHDGAAVGVVGRYFFIIAAAEEEDWAYSVWVQPHPTGLCHVVEIGGAPEFNAALAECRRIIRRQPGGGLRAVP
jgi:hypothetical protein